jgi:hypothetical protein
VARVKQPPKARHMSRRIEAAARPSRARSWPMPRPTGSRKVGRVNTEQMAREGALLSRHPLLIQKTVADKLSDKVQVIIAPPGTDGRFIASGLVGTAAATAAAQNEQEQ